jgi:hypothetical protein
LFTFRTLILAYHGALTHRPRQASNVDSGLPRLIVDGTSLLKLKQSALAAGQAAKELDRRRSYKRDDAEDQNGGEVESHTYITPAQPRRMKQHVEWKDRLVCLV